MIARANPDKNHHNYIEQTTTAAHRNKTAENRAKQNR